MTEVLLYIASSLDGYIARKDGSIDWLSIVETPDTDYGYREFYQSIDALVMGRKTYDLCLSFGEWPYPDKSAYIFTRQELTSERDDVTFISALPNQFMANVAAKGYRRIWLVGGGELVAEFERHSLIDEYIISIIPVFLGEGILLFPPPGPETILELTGSQFYSTGLVQLKYRKKGRKDF